MGSGRVLVKLRTTPNKTRSKIELGLKHHALVGVFHQQYFRITALSPNEINQNHFKNWNLESVEFVSKTFQVSKI